jgi:hypothetical protein
MQDQGLEDGVIRLRDWADEDSAWYAESVRDPLIQRFTTESPTLDAWLVLAAIAGLRGASDAEGFVNCDAVTGERLGNMALHRDGRTGEVSYGMAAGEHGRGSRRGPWPCSARGASGQWACRSCGCAFVGRTSPRSGPRYARATSGIQAVIGPGRSKGWCGRCSDTRCTGRVLDHWGQTCRSPRSKMWPSCPSSSSISRRRLHSVTAPVSAISVCNESPGRADLTCHGI